MAGRKDFIEFFDDFLGDSLDSRWDTNTTGTPTGTSVTDNAGGGKITMALANTSEAEALNLDFGDIGAFKLTNGLVYETRLKLPTAPASVATAVWGVSDDNAAVDSIAVSAWFKVDGGLALVCETDDNTTNNDDVSTGITLTADTWYGFQIDMQDLTSVKFYIDRGNGWERVCASTTFDMSLQSSAYVQPNIRLDKASGTSTPSIVVDYVWIRGRRYVS